MIQFCYLLLVFSYVLFFHDSDLIECIILGISLLLLGCPICWCIIFHSLCISVVPVVMSPFSPVIFKI